MQFSRFSGSYTDTVGRLSARAVTRMKCQPNPDISGDARCAEKTESVQSRVILPIAIEEAQQQRRSMSDKRMNDAYGPRHALATTCVFGTL